MTHSLWWEHLILNAWCCFSSSSSSRIRPPCHVAFISLRVTSAEQRVGFYGSCCSQRTGWEEEEEKAQSGRIWVHGDRSPSADGLGCVRGGYPRVGLSHGREQPRHPGPRDLVFSSRLKDNSQAEGVKNSRLWVRLNFSPSFPLSCFGLWFCRKRSSASAFQMVKMQMPDLRYYNWVSIYNIVHH